MEGLQGAASNHVRRKKRGLMGLRVLPYTAFHGTDTCNIYIYMAPRWHHVTIAPRARKKNNKIMFGRMSKSKSLFLGHFKKPRGHGSMRETLEMITVLRMQNIVEFRKKNICFVTILLFRSF